MRRAIGGIAFVIAVWALVAYLAAPFVWSELERGTAPLPMLTTTPLGIPGDPVNLGLVGTEAEIVKAFHAIGWRPADAITLKSAVEIGLFKVNRTSQYSTGWDMGWPRRMHSEWPGSIFFACLKIVRGSAT